MVLSRHLALVGGALALASAPAWACSPTPQTYDVLPKTAAARGFLVKAKVIRGYNARTRTPELLEIERVFVGSDLPHTVTLFRDDAFYDARARRIYDTCSVEFSEAQPKATLYILYPALPAPDAKTTDAFLLDPFYSIATDGAGLDALLDEAKRLGRLRDRPLPEDR